MSEADQKTSVEHKNSFKKWAKENLLSLGIAFLVVFAIRSSVVEAFKIPSGSMIPTLFVGDHIFVSKFAYGFKIPFSDLVFDEPVYILKRDPPKRGDIIVFKFPRDESLHYIKRVVGVPGDTVEIRSKQLYVNGALVGREPLAASDVDRFFAKNDDAKYTPAEFDLFTEDLTGVKHTIMVQKNSYLDDDRPPFQIGPENLFVMGDNRDFSNDSRFWGTVPFRNVKGKAFIIWLSVWFNFSDGSVSFHPERIGTILK